MKTTTESTLCSVGHGPVQSVVDTASARTHCVLEQSLCERENKKDNKQRVV